MPVPTTSGTSHLRIANDPVATLIVEFMRDKDYWSGKCSELYNKLLSIAFDHGISTSDKYYGIPYTVNTKGEKLVIDYLGLSIMEVQDMDLDLYLYFQREAYIYGLSQTKEGREYLRDCWRITQTKPDRKAAREKFKAAPEKIKRKGRSHGG